MPVTFPTNRNNQPGNILIRKLELSYSMQVMLPNDQDFIDEIAYPNLRHTKHCNIIRTPAGGYEPVTNFASEAALTAAGETFGLLDLTSRKTAQPATVFSFAAVVSYWLLAPAVLTPADVYIHHAVDPDTGNLHPTKFEVNATKADSIGKVTDFHKWNAGPGGATELVWGNYASEYYKDMQA